ncbi:hypothetical protein [Nonomuraea jabiensis]|uniref:hypothetical protein n=1 Tax=Nonomuraea jabiensis TaxID=882448 RepID=UPI003D720CED
MSQHTRLTLIRRAVTTVGAPLPVRVAVCIMLLYAQPLTGISRLTIDDILDQNGEVLLKLGDPPTPVPRPVADLLRELAKNRPNMNTATNPGARWLFHGRRAGQPLNPGTLREQLRQHGYMTGKARPAALRQLVLQAPAPVIARAEPGAAMPPAPAAASAAVPPSPKDSASPGGRCAAHWRTALGNTQSIKIIPLPV